MSLPANTHIGRVELRVADLARSLAFYRDLLGLVEFARTSARCDLGPPDGPPLLSIVAVPGTRKRPPGVVGLYHFALLLPNRGELAQVLLRLFQAHYPFQGFADHGVSEAAYLADPDGNGIELYADRPREDWQWRNGQIVMSTLALNVNNLLRAVQGDDGRGIAPGTTVGHVHLHVGELERSAVFYGNVVGFEVTNRSLPSALFLSAGGYHHHLALNTWLQADTAGTPEIAGLLSWELVVPDDAVRIAITERASALGRHVKAEGNRATVTDPDGMRVLITS